MVNPLGSPGSRSSCPLLPCGVWREQWLPPCAWTHPFRLSPEPTAVPWLRGGTPLALAPTGRGMAQSGCGASCAHTGPFAGGCFPRGSDARGLLAVPTLCQPQARAGLSCPGPCQPQGLCQGQSCDPPRSCLPPICPGLPIPGSPCPASLLRVTIPAEAGITPGITAAPEQRLLCVGLSQAAEEPKAVALRKQLLPARRDPPRHRCQQLHPTRWPCSPPLGPRSPLHPAVEGSGTAQGAGLGTPMGTGTVPQPVLGGMD